MGGGLLGGGSSFSQAVLSEVTAPFGGGCSSEGVGASGVLGGCSNSRDSTGVLRSEGGIVFEAEASCGFNFSIRIAVRVGAMVVEVG